MHRPFVLISSLALLGCVTTPPVQPVPSPAVAAMAAPLPSLDLRVASLPARPAGAAFAMAGVEHALVRLPAPASTPAVPTPTVMPAVMSATPPSAAPGPSLAAHVLAVQAAYRRWCAGTALPGDTALLERAGGTALPGTLACTPLPSASRGQPRALVTVP